MIENPISMVRELKGAPISCLFALMVVRQAVGAEWLARITGYSFKPVNQALLLLEELGLAVRASRYSWGLSAGAMQLPLMVVEKLSARSWNDSNSQHTTTASTRMEEDCEEEVERLSSWNYSNSIDILHAGGVGEPTATRLAGLDWMTPDYIRAHLAKGKADKVRLGLVIHRMRSHDQAPETKEDWDRRRYIEGPYKDWIKH